MSIEVRDVSKRWNHVVGLENVSVHVDTGELIALLGPSGSGKTTLLRIIAGLESADKGVVYFGGEDATEARVRDRGVGFVFQHYALFKHMNVADNIAFGLRVMPRDRRPTETQIKAKAEQLLSLVQLEGMGTRFPAQLSGGQRQRVALARALAVEPKVLLLDEPFGALDQRVREELRRRLRRLHDELRVTTVLVTHDQEEALEVADRVVVMQKGRIEQVGTPTEILDQPQTAFVNEFVGDVNTLHGTVDGGHAQIGALRVPAEGHAQGAKVRALVRTYDLKMWRDEQGIATVTHMHALGDRVKVSTKVDGAGELLAQFPRRSSLLRGVEPGCRVAVEVTLARIYPE
ncbi:MAG: Sulfate and thiosulfate import ATP-binding protein CysA [Myxococcaceae bacterium]|nr:Sulfate and thiosulfate import ATP-binding protein CysA [Myxococcaceae bacterium]